MQKEKQSAQVYSVSEIGDMLNIGRCTSYRFIEEVYRNGKPFLVFKIRDQYRIPKSSFDAWMGITSA